MEQVQKQKSQSDTQQVEDLVVPPTKEEVEELKAKTDEMLDEIDSILEVNAEEFIKGYIQQGGE